MAEFRAKPTASAAFSVFTAQRYSSAVNAMALCLSVSVTSWWNLSKIFSVRKIESLGYYVIPRLSVLVEHRLVTDTDTDTEP